MKKVLIWVLIMTGLFVLMVLPALCKPLVLEPRAEYEKNIKAVSEGPSTTRYYYNETLLKEVFGRSGAPAAGSGDEKIVWEDRGTRWQRLEGDKGSPVSTTIIYKKGINQSGQLEGKKLDDIFSPQFSFDRGWDFADRKVLARAIADRHYLQILVVHDATRTILREIVLSDPERDISSIRLMEDGAEGRKLIVLLAFKKGDGSTGTLYSIDVDSGKPEIISTGVSEAHLSPSRNGIAFWIGDGVQGTAAFYNIPRGDMICSDSMKGRHILDLKWSFDERFLSLTTSDGHLVSLLRLDALKRSYHEFCIDALSLSPSPSGRKALFSRIAGDSGIAYLKSVDPETGKLHFAGKNGEEIVKESRECGALCQIFSLDLDRKKEERLCQATYPDLLSACWSDNEEHVFFFDIKDIYGLSAGRKGGRAEKAAECPRFSMGLLRGALQPLGRGHFYLLQDGVIYLVKGSASKDALVEGARYYRLNDSGTLVAFLAEKINNFSLSIMNFKNRDQIPLILGKRPILSFQWKPRTVQILEVVINPDNVRSDEPVVIQFDEKGDIVPLGSGK
jgi:hypothetical protein